MKKPNRVRYFVCKGNSFYWQPSRRLRIAGWEPVKLPDNLRQARDKAEERNEKLDKWYLGLEEALPQPEVIKTLDKLIERYTDDVSYTKLKPKTRHGYDSRLKKLKEWGSGPGQRHNAAGRQRTVQYAGAEKIAARSQRGCYRPAYHP